MFNDARAARIFHAAAPPKRDKTVMIDKTLYEHNESAFGVIATKRAWQQKRGMSQYASQIAGPLWPTGWWLTHRNSAA
jgi:hypothetical protein